MPKKTKQQKQDLAFARLTKRSGAYVPNSTNTGITKAPKAVQKEFKTTMKKTIKSLKKGL